MTAYEAAVTALAQALQNATTWGSNHVAPRDHRARQEAVRVVDAIMAVVDERRIPPGPCTVRLESFGVVHHCDLLHGHAGMHADSDGCSWVGGDQ